MTIYPNHLVIEGRRYRQELPGALPTGKSYVRVLHECELPEALRHVPPRMPQVVPLFDNHHVPFEKRWQLFSKSLNPLLTPENWTAVYHFRLWIANNQGFGMDGKNGNPLDLRANYVTGQNLKEDLPRVEALTCGGNLLSVIGETRRKTTGAGLTDCYLIETLDYRNSPPETIPPWLVTEATKLDKDGRPTRFPQGRQANGYQPGVRHPLLADPRRVVVVEKWRVERWTEAFAPDPYFVYVKR